MIFILSREHSVLFYFAFISIALWKLYFKRCFYGLLLFFPFVVFFLVQTNSVEFMEFLFAFFHRLPWLLSSLWPLLNQACCTHQPLSSPQLLQRLFNQHLLSTQHVRIHSKSTNIWIIQWKKRCKQKALRHASAQFSDYIWIKFLFSSCSRTCWFSRFKRSNWRFSSLIIRLARI